MKIDNRELWKGIRAYYAEAYDGLPINYAELFKPSGPPPPLWKRVVNRIKYRGWLLRDWFCEHICGCDR